jgi:hypothetical protein
MAVSRVGTLERIAADDRSANAGVREEGEALESVPAERTVEPFASTGPRQPVIRKATIKTLGEIFTENLGQPDSPWMGKARSTR